LISELPRRVLLGNSGLKNRPFASCAGLLKPVGSVAVTPTGLVGAANFAIQPGGGKAGEGKEFVAWKHQQAPFVES
jgi:hypothetical protein